MIRFSFVFQNYCYYLYWVNNFAKINKQHASIHPELKLIIVVY